MQTLNRIENQNKNQDPQGGQSGAGAHYVQFYEDTSIFLDQLAEFAGCAIGSGGACIVIATAEHRRGLVDRLMQWAIDVKAAADRGRFIALDAQETLGAFMVDGWPDRDRFFRAIKPLLARATSPLNSQSGALFIFGEMVALLWQSGRSEAAIRLEQLWSEMGAQRCFSLLCAYPLSCFAGQSQQEQFRRICQEHSQIMPAESFTLPAGESERMRMIGALRQKSELVQSVVEERERAIAQRRRAEDKLWRSQEFARKVMESCIDCVKVLDLEGNLEYVSPSGQSAMEIRDLSVRLGRSWLLLWKEEDHPRIEQAVAAARRGGVGSFQADSTTAGGHRHWDVRITPQRAPDGTVERLIAVSRDMTELRQAQQIAIQAEKVAAAGRMAATIAHEINNPLEAVTNFLYLARTSPGLPDDAARQLEVADHELARVSQIAQKTLGFYRDTTKNRWIGIREMVDDVLLIYERKLRYKRIRTEIAVDPSLKLLVKQGELKQVLSNLLANAIDASREGGSIWLRAHASGRWTDGFEPGIRLAIADNGSGMAPEVQKRIFVPFFTTKLNIGTGIGLWITKSLIEQQGGFLRFRSRQGRGTVMSIFLPSAAHRQVNEAMAA